MSAGVVILALAQTAVPLNQPVGVGACVSVCAERAGGVGGAGNEGRVGGGGQTGHGMCTRQQGRTGQQAKQLPHSRMTGQDMASQANK